MALSRAEKLAFFRNLVIRDAEETIEKMKKSFSIYPHASKVTATQLLERRIMYARVINLGSIEDIILSFELAINHVNDARNFKQDDYQKQAEAFVERTHVRLEELGNPADRKAVDYQPMREAKKDNLADRKAMDHQPSTVEKKSVRELPKSSSVTPVETQLPKLPPVVMQEMFGYLDSQTAARVTSLNRQFATFSNSAKANAQWLNRLRNDFNFSIPPTLTSDELGSLLGLEKPKEGSIRWRECYRVFAERRSGKIDPLRNDNCTARDYFEKGNDLNGLIEMPQVIRDILSSGLQTKEFKDFYSASAVLPVSCKNAKIVDHFNAWIETCCAGKTEPTLKDRALASIRFAPLIVSIHFFKESRKSAAKKTNQHFNSIQEDLLQYAAVLGRLDVVRYLCEYEKVSVYPACLNIILRNEMAVYAYLFKSISFASQKSALMTLACTRGEFQKVDFLLTQKVELSRDDQSIALKTTLRKNDIYRLNWLHARYPDLVIQNEVKVCFANSIDYYLDYCPDVQLVMVKFLLVSGATIPDDFGKNLRADSEFLRIVEFLKQEVTHMNSPGKGS